MIVSILMETSLHRQFNLFGKLHSLIFETFGFLRNRFRSIGLTSGRWKSANLNSKNYYDLLGVEKSATQKEIKQAFFKLSKEVHAFVNRNRIVNFGSSF